MQGQALRCFGANTGQFAQLLYQCTQNSTEHGG
jgi:hypothetical protein